MKFKYLSLLTLMFLGMNSSNAALPDDHVDVAKHLEFMGYDVSIAETHITATHSKEFNLIIKKYREGMLATIYVGSNDYASKHKDDYLELINKLNESAALARYYIDGDNDFFIEGYYIGEYATKLFTKFIDELNLSREQLSEVGDEFSKYIR